jgi:uncharacterized membrane protein YphA (DoxX/SURF4 family)
MQEAGLILPCATSAPPPSPGGDEIKIPLTDKNSFDIIISVEEANIQRKRMLSGMSFSCEAAELSLASFLRRKTMNIALWIVQTLLALAFLLAGSMKVSQPIERLRKRMNWANHVSPAVVRLVGSLEILGAVGLILPALIHILPWLTPVAALGLVLTMIGAAIVHIRLKEFSGLGAPLVLLLLALFIVYGRFLLVPLT